MTKQENLLMWVDLETTGTDVESDDIIEIAVIWTTPDLEELSRWEAIVGWSPAARYRIDHNDVVKEMHRVNGLYQKINDGEVDYEWHEAPAASDHLLYEMERVNVSSGREPFDRMVLAGSGVAHFDRKFLNSQFPKVAEMLRYYVLDVGVIRRAWRMWTDEVNPSIPQSDKTHRAMEDIELHLEE